MADKAEKKPIYKKWWFWVIVIIFVGSIGVGMRGGSDNISKTAEDSKKNESSQQETAKTYKIGDAVEIEGVSVTVDSMQRGYTSELMKPDDGQEYIMLTVTIKNNSGDKKSYNAYDWNIETSEGDIHSYEAMAQGSNALNSGDIANGGKKTGTLVFEVPKNDTGLKVHYKANYFLDNEVVIELHD